MPILTAGSPPPPAPRIITERSNGEPLDRRLDSLGSGRGSDSGSRGWRKPDPAVVRGLSCCPNRRIPCSPPAPPPLISPFLPDPAPKWPWLTCCPKAPWWNALPPRLQLGVHRRVLRRPRRLVGVERAQRQRGGHQREHPVRRCPGQDLVAELLSISTKTSAASTMRCTTTWPQGRLERSAYVIGTDGTITAGNRRRRVT